MSEIHDLEVTTIDGAREKLSKYAGRTLLIVNVASKCGFTPQYAGLEALYRKYAARGLVVLGFPCDQFGHQEPGGEAEIRAFCSQTYDVTFPMFAKIEVNGSGTHPVYALLKRSQRAPSGEQDIEWNFTKFLVSPTGEVVRRYAPKETPESIDAELEARL
ncbi:MAG: glutathione peroxidase [Sorangiineae bacterium]|nr:glutathione peroxidase [Polyangiaceae bacterium]MEB2323840.1 glutathione peroxidase [Sorangiineae bacterium]